MRQRIYQSRTKIRPAKILHPLPIGLVRCCVHYTNRSVVQLPPETIDRRPPRRCHYRHHGNERSPPTLYSREPPPTAAVSLSDFLQRKAVAFLSILCSARVFLNIQSSGIHKLLIVYEVYVYTFCMFCFCFYLIFIRRSIPRKLQLFTGRPSPVWFHVQARLLVETNPRAVWRRVQAVRLGGRLDGLARAARQVHA